MSRFCGCSFVLMVFLLLIKVSVTPVAGQDDNPLVELSSRSEMVELAGYGEEKISSVVVTGTVVCESCLESKIETTEFPIPNALVSISCKNGRKKMETKWAYKETTNEYGDFVIDLPSHLHAIPHLEKACRVKVLQVPKDSPCNAKSTRRWKSSRIRLSSSSRGSIRSYTVGDIRLQQTLTLSGSCLAKKPSETKWRFWSMG